MIQLHNPIPKELLINLGNTLQEYQEYELGYFYADKEEFGEVGLWLYLPGNGHLIGRHVTVHYVETHGNSKEFLESFQKLAQDLNTLLNLKVPEACRIHLKW